MPHHTTQAIVLYSQDLAEWDKLTTFFTRDFGKLKGVAKGAKRSRKRFGSGLEPLTSITLSFVDRERSNLTRLEYCQIIDAYPGIHGDVLKLGYASYLTELIHEMTAEREVQRELFMLFTTFLTLLDKTSFREEFIRIFELRLLALSGYQPELKRCVICKREVHGERELRFHLDKGGLVCSQCFKGSAEYPSLSGGTIKTLQHAQTIELDKVTRLFFTAQAREESKKLLTCFIEYHLERPLKSLRFIEHLAAGQLSTLKTV